MKPEEGKNLCVFPFGTPPLSVRNEPAHVLITRSSDGKRATWLDSTELPTAAKVLLQSTEEAGDSMEAIRNRRECANDDGLSLPRRQRLIGFFALFLAVITASTACDSSDGQEGLESQPEPIVWTFQDIFFPTDETIRLRHPDLHFGWDEQHDVSVEVWPTIDTDPIEVEEWHISLDTGDGSYFIGFRTPVFMRNVVGSARVTSVPVEES